MKIQQIFLIILLAAIGMGMVSVSEQSEKVNQGNNDPNVLISRFKPDEYIGMTSGRAMTMKIYKTTGNTKILWTFEDAGDGYVRIKNVDNGKYMHCENGGLQVADIDANRLSSHWKIEPVDGYIKLLNRGKNLYLHNENSILEVGKTKKKSKSTHWKKRAP